VLNLSGRQFPLGLYLSFTVFILCGSSEGLAQETNDVEPPTLPAYQVPQEMEDNLRRFKSAILSGVPVLDLGSGADVAVAGMDAYPILSGAGGEHPKTILAVAELGKGRIVATGQYHVVLGFLVGKQSSLSVEEENKQNASLHLFKNILRWSTRKTDMRKIRFAVTDIIDSNWAPWVDKVQREWGMKRVALKNLRNADVLIWRWGGHSSLMTQECMEETLEFIQDGGALIVHASGWGNIQNSAALPASRGIQSNQILAEAGLWFRDGGADPPFGEDGLEDSWRGHAGIQLQRLRPLLEEGVEDPDWRTRMNVVQYALSSNDGLWRGPKDNPFVQSVRDVLLSIPSADYQEVFPGFGQAEVELSPRSRTAQRLWEYASLASTPGFLGVAPGFWSYPGTVLDDISRPVKKKVFRDLKGNPTRRWIPTGLYAPPGEAVKIRVSPLGNPRTSLGWGRQQRVYQMWGVQIGCANDDLRSPKRGKLRRWMDVSHRITLYPDSQLRLSPEPGSTKQDSLVNVVHSPFGGLIFLIPPSETTTETEITISGAHPAPYYKEQASKIPRRSGVPWGYLEGKHALVVLPTSTLLKLRDQAGKVTEFWDQAVATAAQFVGRGDAVPHQIFVPDIQIGAGYMHSGYPIMTHLDVAKEGDQPFAAPTDPGNFRSQKKTKIPLVVDLATLKETGSWGHFHEIGHNLQDPAWTFSGTGEVTNNIIALWLLQEMGDSRNSRISPVERPWFGGKDAVLEEAYRYFADENIGQTAWNLGVGLLFFVQMTEAKRGFHDGMAEILGPTIRGIKAEADRLRADGWASLIHDTWSRDQWYIFASGFAKRDLLPHFRAYRVEVSEKAIEKVKRMHLDPWMHPDIRPFFDWGIPRLAEGPIRFLGQQPWFGWKKVRETWKKRRAGDGASAQARLDQVYLLLSRESGRDLNSLFRQCGFAPGGEIVARVKRILASEDSEDGGS
jgi:hypothetical protein